MDESLRSGGETSTWALAVGTLPVGSAMTISNTEGDEIRMLFSAMSLQLSMGPHVPVYRTLIAPGNFGLARLRALGGPPDVGKR